MSCVLALLITSQQYCWHSWSHYSSTHHDVVTLHLSLLACQFLTLQFQPETSDQVMNVASLALSCLAVTPISTLYLHYAITWPHQPAQFPAHQLHAAGTGTTERTKHSTLCDHTVPRQLNRKIGKARSMYIVTEWRLRTLARIFAFVIGLRYIYAVPLC